MEQARNYIKEYYMQQEHDITSLISNGNIDEDSIRALKRQINDLQKQIEEKRVAIHNIYDKAYSTKYEPITQKIILHYNGRTSDYYFDLESGLPYNDEDIDNTIIYKVDTKRGEIEVVVGYNYELASIITKKYKYTISKDNDKVVTKMFQEKVISFLDTKVAIKTIFNEGVEIREYQSYLDKALSNITDYTFINKLYSTDYKGKLKLADLLYYSRKNKSFEIIIKTAPKEIVDDLIKLDKIDKPLPIYKMLGLSQEIYDKAIELGTIKKVFEHRFYINGTFNKDIGIYKTEKEWLEFIEEIKAYEEDLDFYNISYSNTHYPYEHNLFTLLVDNYINNHQIFKEYYTLGKFCNYVITETINQGYNRINDFIMELRDYLNMCKCDNIKPTLYSSYLRQTHDITSRNHKVIVEKEKEDIFISRYNDFKEYKGKEYMVIAPKNSNDLKKEGDTLNHCVASYIKKVIDGECLILFLRKDREESLITIEIRHNNICQVRGLHNRKPTEKEIKALKDFAKCRNYEVNF